MSIRPMFASVATLTSLAASGCQAPPAIPRDQPAYTWHEPGPRVESDVTVSVVLPELSARTTNSLRRNSIQRTSRLYEFARPTIEALQSGLQNGLHDMFVGKGINPRGKFQNPDSMTYPDKRATDLMVYPLIDIEASAVRTNVSAGWSSVTESWTVSWGGEIVVRMVEPLSGELFWQRRFPFASQTENLQFVTSGTPEGTHSSDNAIENTLSGMIKRAYEDVMAQVSTYVSAEELTNLKHLSDQCKDRTVHSSSSR